MKLSNIFTSNMVFAVNKPIKVFGTGKGSAVITFNGISKNVESSNDSWLVEFSKMNYGGPYELCAKFGDEEVVLNNIYIGEVYMISGQSNMQFKLKDSSTKPNLWQDNDKCRLFSTDRLENGEFFKSKDGWVICDKVSAGNWSAIGYLVGNEISKNKDIAVGIIACYQGASIIESWLPEGTSQKLGINIPNDKKYMDHYYEDYKLWNKEGVLYNYALKQVIPYSMNGIIWYQGESDADGEEAVVYINELKELITVWRKDFNDLELPFIIIQIADCDSRINEGWRLVQKAQLDVQNELKNVKTVISKDISETDTIHPVRKDELASRIVEAVKSI